MYYYLFIETIKGVDIKFPNLLSFEDHWFIMKRKTFHYHIRKSLTTSMWTSCDNLDVFQNFTTSLLDQYVKRNVYLTL